MSLFGASSSSGQPNNNTTTSTTSAGGGLFGSSTTPTTLSGGLFGGQSQSTPTFSFGSAASGGNSTATTSLGTPGGGLFGNTSTKPAEQKPLFGAATSAPSASSTPSLGGAGENLFGGSSLTPSGASMFGSKPGATSTGTGNSLFSNTSLTPNITTTSTTPTTTAPTGKIFGQENPVANQGASTVKPGGLFGGAAATGASLFGGANSNATSAAQATPAKPAFPLNSTTPAGAPPSNTSKPSGTANLFGSTGNTTSQSGSSPFPTAQQGEKKESQTTNLFANQASSQSKPATVQPAASLFLAAGQPQKTAPSLFGATKPAESPSLFGAKPATPATTEGAGSKSGAGSAGGLSLFGQQAQPKPAEAAPPVKPAGSLFASAPASNPTSASAPAPATTQGGSLFGGANKLTTGATTTEPPKTQPSLFGTTPASTAAASTTTTTTTAPSSSTPASTGASAPSTTATSTTAAAPTGSLFGATKAAPAAESVAPKPATSQTTGLGASTSGPTSSMARLKNRTMDEILNRWATDLSKYQKEFKEQASQVAAWDRLLVENGDKIQKLYLNTFEAEKASREVERHLVTVESQQEELESWLDKYEVEVDTLFSKQIGSGEQLAGPDQERERTYKLAEKITERLDEMGRDLSKMIKEINDISGTVSKGSKPDDPLSQIVRVLNGHLTQLQWIDANATALQAKVTAAQKASSQIGNQYGGPEQDNVDSFYRSYIGRR